MRSFPPGLLVEHSELWAYIPADGDVSRSAAEAAVTRAPDRLGVASTAVDPVGRWWLPAIRPAVEAGCTGVFLLLPDGDDGPPAAVVRLDRFEGDPAVPPARLVDDVVRGLLLPDRLQVAPPRMEPVPGTGGERVRLRQRARGTRRGEAVEHASWALRAAGAVWTLSTSFTDAAVAARWLPEIDSLVEGVGSRAQYTDDGTVVVRPDIPEPRPRVGFGHSVARSYLAIDRERGEVTWADDNVRQRRVQLPLGSGPGEVAALLRARYRPSYYGPWYMPDECRLMLVDGEGRVLARSASWVVRNFDRGWPVGLLEATGLPVHDQRFENTSVMNEVYPGSAPMSWLTGNFWMTPLLAVLAFVLMIAVGGLVVGDPIWSDW